MEPPYRMILDLENRLSTYFDETEFPTYEEAIGVAKYIALNGYPSGPGLSYRVKTVKIVEERTLVTIQGEAYQPPE